VNRVVPLVAGRVLVTGATGGIGQAISRAFAARGASLVLSGRRADVLAALAAELDAESVVADLSDAGDLDRLVRAAGEVDVVVANAALPASGLLTEFSQAQIDTMLDVNLRAPIALARALVPRMTARHRGQLVFISSLSAKATAPSSSIYSATKFGLRGFALGLREDLRRQGVGVSLVLPGFVSDAGMFAESRAKLPPGVGTRTPEQVASAVLHAVECDRAEVTVAPLSLRIGADIASVAPGVSAAFQRIAGGAKVARAVSDGQSDKRP
jgi:short-subunit dehydrogenase